MRVLYSALLYLLTPLLLARLVWQSLSGQESWQRVPERFGHVARHPSDTAVWIHAASVGEVQAALPLIRRIVALHPAGSVLVTTATATGSAQVRAALGSQVRHSYAPYDLPHVVSRFVGRMRPRRVIVMETELWPNLFRALARRNVPLIVASARLSPRSVAGYSRVRGLAASTLSDCRLIAAQSELDAQRFRELGAPRERVCVMGNLKFDFALPEDLIARGRELRRQLGERPVWIAASTHEGEETAALAAHRALLAQYPQALLVLVPRHPQRFDGVARLIAQTGIEFVRRSSFKEMPLVGPHPVLLADSMGELPMFLAAADLAFVGGSLVTVGGHNVLEPAALGLPVLFGPHMFNFQTARDLLLVCGAAQQLAAAADLAPAVSALLADASKRLAMGEAGRRVIAANRGALERLMTMLEQV